MLTTKAEISAAIEMMHPVAVQAAGMLAEAIMADPSLSEERNYPRLERIVNSACSLACQNAGLDAIDPDIDLFIASQGAAVFKLAIAVAVYTVNQQQKPKWLGALGKMATLGLGIAIGAFAD